MPGVTNDSLLMPYIRVQLDAIAPKRVAQFSDVMNRAATAALRDLCEHFDPALGATVTDTLVRCGTEPQESPVLHTHIERDVFDLHNSVAGLDQDALARAVRAQRSTEISRLVEREVPICLPVDFSVENSDLADILRKCISNADDLELHPDSRDEECAAAIIEYLPKPETSWQLSAGEVAYRFDDVLAILREIIDYETLAYNINISERSMREIVRCFDTAQSGQLDESEDTNTDAPTNTGTNAVLSTRMANIVRAHHAKKAHQRYDRRVLPTDAEVRAFSHGPKERPRSMKTQPTA